MGSYVVGALALGALCGAWALVQRWIAHRDPEVKGPESGCHGCGGCGSCERDEEPEPPPLPQATAREKPHS